MARVKKERAVQEEKYSLVYLMPLIVVLVFIPVLIYQINVPTGLTKYDWFVGTSTAMDFFLRAKSIWLYISFGFTIFIMLFMILSEEIKPIWDAILIPLFVYGVLCLLSACFSIDRTYSFKGIYEQFESVWMLLGYVLLVYFAFYNFRSEAAVRRIMPWLVGGIAFLTVLGLCQAFGLDPVQYKPLQKIFVTDKRLLGHLKLKFGEGRVYMSLYNPNYVGFYTVMMIPVLMALLLHTKKMIARVIYGLLIAGLLICLFASQSRAGIVALVVAVIILIIGLRSVLLKKWYVTAGLVLLAGVGFVVVNQMNNNILIQRLQGMFQSEKETYELESIVTGDDVAITLNGNEFHVEVQGEGDETVFLLHDQDGAEILSTKADSGETIVNDERFPFRLEVINRSNFKGFGVTTTLNQNVDGVETPVEKQWVFTNQMISGDDTYYVKAGGASLFHMKKVEKGLPYLENHYSLANNRGYIWAKTWSVLKKYPLLGSGPDTFTIAFPNHDLVGLYNSGHDGELVTKPHCMYLQIAAQTGIPALIAYITFFVWYIISGIRLYWKQDFSELLPKIGVALMVSVIGYLIMGLTNDSCIAVSPIFFVLTGMGLGINYHLKKKKSSQA
ncbi:MAG: O-antigen ligase family protein [Lachnospiraceae bacterium]|nr:O-antigen ligase family protein [Lachnospiraceae bacterium]